MRIPVILSIFSAVAFSTASAYAQSVSLKGGVEDNTTADAYEKTRVLQASAQRDAIPQIRVQLQPAPRMQVGIKMGVYGILFDNNGIIRQIYPGSDAARCPIRPGDVMVRYPLGPIGSYQPLTVLQQGRYVTYSVRMTDPVLYIDQARRSGPLNNPRFYQGVAEGNR